MQMLFKIHSSTIRMTQNGSHTSTKAANLAKLLLWKNARVKHY